MKIKKKLFFIVWIIILFVSITLLTATFEKPFDGNNTYGFPLIFHTAFGGKCFACPPWVSTNYLNLLLDLMLVIPIAIGIDYGIRKLK